MRTLKLIFNLSLSALISNYFITILVLLLNPQVLVNSLEFLTLYLNLLVFYGPLSFLFVGATFFIIQFFSEKKYPIGIFEPPTITYFLSFTILVISFAFFLNYDYYLPFFSVSIKLNFITVLSINLALIIIGVLFIFFKKMNKKWVQVLFLVVLAYNMLHSYTAIINNTLDGQLDSRIEQGQLPSRQTAPRKIRIVIMDGLSLKLIYQLSSGQKLLNFNEVINNGISSNVEMYKPNLSLSLLNTALTGLKPSEFTPHSNTKFKFDNVKHEFDVRPRYILFRKSAHIEVTSFYNKNDNFFLDFLSPRYEQKQYRTIRYIQPENPPIYSEKSLRKNNRFVPLFPDVQDKKGPKYDLLKRSFFFDDYLLNTMRRHWRDDQLHFSVVRFPGLGAISKHFFQYHNPDIGGGNISQKEIKEYGWIIEKYYEYYSSIIGNMLSSTGENELLVILSFFEYEPLPVWRRILVKLFDEKDIFVYRSLSSQGTILLYEKNALKKDYPLKSISLYDIYPTLLYYSGFQLPKDLEGEVIREIFTDEFVLNNPIDIDTNYNRVRQ